MPLVKQCHTLDGLWLLLAGLLPVFAAESNTNSQWLGPLAISISLDAKTFYVACERTRKTLAIDAKTGAIQQSSAHFDAADQLQALAHINFPAHGLCSPVLSRKQGQLFICDRFKAKVLVIDPKSGKTIKAIPVVREPIAAALTPDERLLVVANHLPEGPANASVVAAAVTIIETESLQVKTNLVLPSGSTSLRGVAISPDGKYACVTHNFARFKVPATQVERGWMNDSALSVIDLEGLNLKATILLDENEKGAANPWGVGWSSNGQWLVVAHSGTHEVSVINALALIEKLGRQPPGQLVDDMTFLQRLRKRIPLRGKGPRSLAIVGDQAYVAEYFTDTISIVDLNRQSLAGVIQLNSGFSLGAAGQGERLFHDATLSHQSWQSCASCHPEGRADGLTWDLLNDGIGNPKKTKSLVLCFQTPPAMSLGVRETAKDAVRSGLRHILFAVLPEGEAQNIDEYLKSLRPLPSPHLIDGKLSAAAQRGKRLFESEPVGCASCHPAPLFTDLKLHTVGTANIHDKGNVKFDTPSLVEGWRHGPYLHDGSVKTIKELLTTRNRQDQHGRTTHLTDQELEDLAAYVLSI